MGYDMSAVSVPEEIEAVHEAARSAARSASALVREHAAALTDEEEQAAHEVFNGEGDESALSEGARRLVELQRAARDAWDKEDETDLGYFRLNVWGMGWMRSTMSAAGLLDHLANPIFPTREEMAEHFKVPEARLAHVLDDEEADLSEEDTSLLNEVRTMHRQLLEVRSPVDGMVPTCKFGSNDGWVVTPDECRLIAAGMRSLTVQQIAEAVERPRVPTGDMLLTLGAALGAIRAAGEGEQVKAEAPLAVVDWSDDEQLAAWVKTCARWADYNERCAEWGGYEVW